MGQRREKKYILLPFTLFHLISGLFGKITIAQDTVYQFVSSIHSFPSSLFLTIPPNTMSRALAAVRSLDHLVLTCASIPRTVSWYSKYLGMKQEVFTPPATPDTQRVALKFGTQKINLHEKGREFEPKASTALPDGGPVFLGGRWRGLGRGEEGL